MTIKQAGKGVVADGTEFCSYRIGFNDGDETELEAMNIDELQELWRSLCPELDCMENSIDYVEKV